MDVDKYSHSVSLACPTCGCTEFEYDDGAANEMCKCIGCRRTISKQDLIDGNSENIEAHVDEIGKKAVDDIAKDFAKSLSRSGLSKKK
jgi:hypothetical protein